MSLACFYPGGTRAVFVDVVGFESGSPVDVEVDRFGWFCSKFRSTCSPTCRATPVDQVTSAFVHNRMFDMNYATRKRGELNRKDVSSQSELVVVQRASPFSVSPSQAHFFQTDA